MAETYVIDPITLLLLIILASLTEANPVISVTPVAQNSLPDDSPSFFNRTQYLMHLRVNLWFAYSHLPTLNNVSIIHKTPQDHKNYVHSRIKPPFPKKFHWKDSQFVRIVKHLSCYRKFFKNLGFGLRKNTHLPCDHTQYVNVIRQIDHIVIKLNLIIQDELADHRALHMNKPSSSLTKPCKPFKEAREKRKRLQCKACSKEDALNMTCKKIEDIYEILLEDYRHTLYNKLYVMLFHSERGEGAKMRWLRGNEKHTTRKTRKCTHRSKKSKIADMLKPR